MHHSVSQPNCGLLRTTSAAYLNLTTTIHEQYPLSPSPTPTNPLYPLQSPFPPSILLYLSTHPTMDPDPPKTTPTPSPSILRWTLGFLLVGACWGLTTPFMRRAALNYTPPQRPSLTDPANSWLKRKVLGIWYAVIGTLSRPAYAVPFLLNVTGSVWFFILIGKAGMLVFNREGSGGLVTGGLS